MEVRWSVSRVVVGICSLASEPWSVYWSRVLLLYLHLKEHQHRQCHDWTLTHTFISFSYYSGILLTNYQKLEIQPRLVIPCLCGWWAPITPNHLLLQRVIQIAFCRRFISSVNSTERKPRCLPLTTGLSSRCLKLGETKAIWRWQRYM